MSWTVFEYLYRDADNHKAFGKVAFSGSVSSESWNRARQKLDDRTHFIAEQVGLPPLYGQLFRWSGGAPTDADHCWHEFVSVSVVEEGDLAPAILKLGKVATFIERLSAVEEWDIWLSPMLNAECRNVSDEDLHIRARVTPHSIDGSIFCRIARRRA